MNLSNPNDYRWSLRALLADMDAWVKTDTAPPDSVYPQNAKSELATPSTLNFPKIAGQKTPLLPKMAPRLDFGPEFAIKGIVTVEPPVIGESYAVTIPQADSDGIDLGGIRMPEVAVPLATYTGWNLRDASIGAPEQLYSMQGSMIPFPLLKTAGDSRMSIGQRYKNRADYLVKVKAAATELVGKKLLLKRDIDKIVERSAIEWDALTNGAK